MITSVKRAALCCALLSATCLSAPLLAQTATTTAFPVRQFTDGNGVDLLSGAFTTASTQVQIGDADTGLFFQREIRFGLYADNLLGSIKVNGSTYTVAIGGGADIFVLSGGVYSPVEQRGSTLTISGSTFTYTMADGTAATFLPAGNYSYGNAQGIVLDSITYPSGKKLNFHYTTASFVSSPPIVQPPVSAYGRRLQSVTSNTGYQMKFTYQLPTLSSSGDVGPWGHVIKVTGINDLFDSCATSANSCTPASARPSLSISSLGTTYRDYTNSTGDVTRYSFDSSQNVSAIRRPGSSTDDVTVEYYSASHTNAGKVWRVTVDGLATTYNYFDGGSRVTITRGTASREVIFDLQKKQMISSRDELGKLTKFEYDASNRLKKVIAPELNSVGYDYDTRGNVLTTTATSKNGAVTITSSASYDSSCTMAVKCNKPNSTTDARGYTTDYTYELPHGGLRTVTAPSPAGGDRPQTTVSYDRFAANGALSQIGIVRPIGTTTCATATTCAGNAKEVKTVIGYGNNLLPTTTTVKAGDNSLTATSTMTYDANGNLLTVDGPLTDVTDVVRYRYDAGRRLVGTVSADPDGASPTLKHRAVRTTYNGVGQVTKVEAGTVLSQNDSDWAGMTVLQTADISYDRAWKAQEKLTAQGSVQSVVQYYYDELGRLKCTALRMDKASFGALAAPSAAAVASCPAGTSPDGPDRITQRVYDDANRVTEVRSAVGTALESIDSKTGYTNNGLVWWVTDGENNQTTYEYDGFDRLKRTVFPVPLQGQNMSNQPTDANPGDYEELGYDAAGNVTSKRLRDGQSIGYQYDALNRITSKDLPAPESDVSYGYDLLGRMTSASDSNGTWTIAYDGLGRRLSVSHPSLPAMVSSYDAAGRRTRVTHTGGFHADYTYLATGEMKTVTENGGEANAYLLATYDYDDLGRRTALTRGNGTATSYAYGAAGGLQQMVNDHTGTADDLTLGFGYNPAGQITSNSRSNDTYAWGRHYLADRVYATNGLNQYTGAGSDSFSYDPKGNLSAATSAGVTTNYGYSSENKLLTFTGGTVMYDALGRLLWHTGPSVFLYDGDDLAMEYSNFTGTVLRRYVHGAGADEPLVWYEGTGTATRRFLHADERGSIIAITASDGSLYKKNSYDEYGIPAVANEGRFQYTGQTWHSQLGLYNYKARFYSPTLGRFLQTDPIGYGDGMNMYAYTGGDPVNRTDPSGQDYWNLDCSKTHDPKSCSLATGAALGAICSNNPSACIYTKGEIPIIVNGQRPEVFPYILPPQAAASAGDLPRGTTSGATGSASSGTPPVGKSAIPKPTKQCSGWSPNLTASVDVGVFVGYGAGFTLGIDWNTRTGTINAFSSVRVGKGLGLIGGAGVGAATSGQNPGYSSSTNAAVSFGAYGGGVSVPAGGGGPSMNGGVSVGPKLGAEISRTNNMTHTRKLVDGGERLCVTD